jgi:aspartyl-tRNA(Asn)/glutamyl-tRNA(Gln) amidotransferase subunit C
VSDRLSIDEVAHVAKLARLALTTDELQLAAHQLSGMLEHFDDIDELDLTVIEPMTQPYHLVNVMRDDVEADTLDRDEVLAAAPQAESGRFRVPSGGGAS